MLHLAPDDLSFAGSADRFAKNIAALRLLHTLETAQRPATDAERRVLARYTAFGESALLNRLFCYDAAARRYVVHADYEAILSAEAAQHLRTAALTAFYTPLDLIHALWDALTRLGVGDLDTLHVLEPAAGVGHLIAGMPLEVRRRAQITAVELDPVSGTMLRHIHPDVTVHAGIGFEAVALPPNGFDLAISNVPFGAQRIHDPTVPDALTYTLHDYFFAKALRLVRPGGLIAYLTSWGTLDKQASTLCATMK